MNKGHKFFAVLVVAGAVFAVTNVQVQIARAGDTDGIAGYSVRLKQKDFDGSDGSGGLNSTIVIEEKSASQPAVQQTPGSSGTFDWFGALVVKWNLLWKMLPQ